MKAQATINQNGGVVSLNKWAMDMGITPITAWRLRKKGWLDTVNICGRVYVTAAANARFTERAMAGEFAKEHKVPKRQAITA
jgi:hypothetical protein